MQSLLRVAATATLIASAALCQVVIPPHSVVYNGFTRGYNFTAATAFTIARLQLPPDAMQAGDTGSFMVRVNGTTALRTVGVAGDSIYPNLAINNGDVVDILGNWSPAVTNNFTAHNSYTATGPFATTIAGVPHTIQRTGWQWDIGDAAYLSGAYLAPGAGQMGRIFLYTNVVPGTATVTPYGSGCVDRAGATFYELFQAGLFDLSNTSMTLTPTGTGYVVTPGGTGWVTPTAANLGLTDDSVSAALPLGFTLNYPGGNTSSVYASSNGYVWAQTNTNNGCCGGDPVGLRTLGARWCPLWNDLNPSVGGQVQFDVAPGMAAVTWTAVPEFGTTNPNTFQVVFFSSGVVEMHWQACSVLSHITLTGWSPGANNRDPGSVDLSVVLPVVTQPDLNALILGASPRPVLGNVVVLTSTQVPSNATIGATILSFTQYNPGIDLTPLGMPGCQQYVGLTSSQIFLPAGGTGSTNFGIPINPIYSGIHVFAQSAAFASGTTPLGVVSSNGVDLLTGIL